MWTLAGPKSWQLRDGVSFSTALPGQLVGADAASARASAGGVSAPGTQAALILIWICLTTELILCPGDENVWKFSLRPALSLSLFS